jgi:hypothetical protein
MPFSFTTWCFYVDLIYFCLACAGETTLRFQGCSEEDRVWQDTGCLQAEAGMWLQSVFLETAAYNNLQDMDCSVLVIVTDCDWKWCWMVFVQDDDEEAEAEESDKSKSEINDDDEDEDVCSETNWREFLFLMLACWLLIVAWIVYWVWTWLTLLEFSHVLVLTMMLCRKMKIWRTKFL